MTENIEELLRQHTIDDVKRFDVIDGKLDAILSKVNPMNDTYVFSEKLWRVFLGFLGFLGLLGGAVLAFSQLWHLLFPPKL